MSKKKPQGDPKRDESTESCDENDNTSECSHINQSVDTQKVLETLMTRGLLSGCEKCNNTGIRRIVDLDFHSYSLWLCLRCGNQACGQLWNGHALQHYNNTTGVLKNVIRRCESHALCVNTRTWGVWCYDCEDYVNVTCKKKLLEAIVHIQKHVKDIENMNAIVAIDGFLRPSENTKHQLLKDLKNLDRQLTRTQSVLKTAAVVNELVPYNKFVNLLCWAIQSTTSERVIEHLITNGADVNRCTDDITPLIYAIVVKSLNKVKVLVSHGANVNQTVLHFRNATPLTYAAYSDQIYIVEYLLQHGADPNLIGRDGKTPLSWAITKENVQIVKFLIANGAIIDKADENGETPIMLAKQKGNREILQMLYDADSTEMNTLKLLKEAIQKNLLEDIKLLSVKRININTIDNEGNTLLHYAIMSGNTEIVEYLIESKANVCKPGKNGKSPLLIAVETGNIDIIKLLLRHGAGDTIQSAFFQAVTLQNLEIIKLLIEHGALFDINYKDGHTPLTKSIQIENLDIVKVLIEHGADVNMPKSDGTSPLSLTLKTGNLEIYHCLINNDAKLASNEGSECLLKYVEDDNFDLVQILVELGAKVDNIYECGETPLTKAAKLENFEMVKYLIEKGANVNQSNGSGKVPLAVAASNKDIRVAKLLIQSKASLDLAKEEIEEFANFNEDFDIYLKMLKKSSNRYGNNTKMNPFGGCDQEAAP